MSETDEQMRREMVKTAKSIVAGDLDLIRGCRKLTWLSRKAAPADSIFNSIVGFESETDDYPLDEVRGTYQKAYLEKLDREISEYTDRSRSGVLDSCRLIIAKYGQ